MEVIVTIVSKLVYNLLKGLITYLYRGYNPVSKYHGHPSRIHGKWYMYLRTFIIQINHSCREIIYHFRWMVTRYPIEKSGSDS